MCGMREPSGYECWCQAHGVAHGHCPYECEHPQPILADDGKLYCGACWFKNGELSEMIPCTPDVCD